MLHSGNCGLTNKHSNRLEKLARDKHSSLLQKSVNYGCKKLYSTGPRLESLRTNALAPLASLLVRKKKVL
jgi:hypothetical protein